MSDSGKKHPSRRRLDARNLALFLFGAFTSASFAAAAWFLTWLSEPGLLTLDTLILALWITGPLIAAFITALVSARRLWRMSAFGVVSTAFSAWLYPTGLIGGTPGANAALILAAFPYYLWGGFLLLLAIGSGIWPFKKV